MPGVLGRLFKRIPWTKSAISSFLGQRVELQTQQKVTVKQKYTKIQYSAGKVYSVQLSYCNLASSGFWGRHSGRLAFPTSPRFISESRSWRRSASICSCFVAARGRAMLFKIWSLSDSLLASAVTISTSKPFLDWNELKCNRKGKTLLEVVETLCTKPTKKWIHKDLTTNLNFEWILPSKFSSDRPGIIALFCSLWKTETKLSSIKMCLGNFASRCDLAKKPKNGISCCSLSDRPSVMTWAVAPSSSVAARSNNKVLPAFP